MPTGSLPTEAKQLWESVYDKALSGSCDGNKECAAKSAWKAVENAGYSKDDEGKWTKKSVADLATFTLTITKTSHNKTDGEFRWYAVGSDTEDDLAGDNMTLELFSDFVARIDANEPAPVQFQSSFWKGGMPYLSVSHYLDQDGKAVPGPLERVYIDGNRLKANGRFDMSTEIGRKAYEAVRKSVNNPSADEPPIRISIGFIDWRHTHKSSGNVFNRKSLDEICPECVGEWVLGNAKGKSFHRGQLVHLAMTRIPQNPRSAMEVESMAEKSLTRKDDAASIIGDELAEKLEKEALEAKSGAALVIKMDEEDDEKKPEEDDDMEDKSALPPVVSEPEHTKDMSHLGEKLDAIIKMLEDMNSKSAAVPVQVFSHPLLDAFKSFAAEYDRIETSSNVDDDKLAALQVPFNTFSEVIISSVKKSAVEEPVVEDDTLKILRSLQSGMERLSLEVQTLKGAMSNPVTAPAVPARRSLSPAAFKTTVDSSTKDVKPNTLRTLARKSAGLEY